MVLSVEVGLACDALESTRGQRCAQPIHAAGVRAWQVPPQQASHEMLESMTTHPERYSEKLWPAWWIWLAAGIVGGSASLTFFPISIGFGLLAMGIGMALLIFALVITTPRLEVGDGWLSTGRARIEVRHVGRVVAHRDQAAREQLGPGFDARSFQCIRGWIGPVVTAEIIDPEDPTPYWIFSTRHPEAVLSALGSSEPVRHTGVSVRDPE